jgi:hypothetical protein
MVLSDMILQETSARVLVKKGLINTQELVDEIGAVGAGTTTNAARYRGWLEADRRRT